MTASEQIQAVAFNSLSGTRLHDIVIVFNTILFHCMTTLTVSLPSKLSNELNRFVRRSDVPCDHLVQRALREYFDDMNEDVVRFKRAYRERKKKTLSHSDLKESLGF